MSDTLIVDNLSFEVRRSERRRTVALTVERDGRLVARVPASYAEDDLRGWLEGKLVWAHEKLARQRETVPQVSEPEYVTGERVAYLGRTYRLTIVKDQVEPLMFDGTCFTLRQEARSAALEHFRRWFISRGTDWVNDRIRRLLTKVGVKPARVEVRDLGYRWGSCGRHQALFVNWKALQLPARYLDYLLIHELAHLIERNHSPAFWRRMDQALPDWKLRQEELRLKAKGLYWCGVMRGE